MEWLQGKKTYIIAIIGVLLILVQFLAGDVTLMQFLQSEQFLALLALFGIGTMKAGITRDIKENGTNPNQ